MAFKFLFPFESLNLSFLSKKKKSEILKKSRLNVIKVVEIFELESQKIDIRIYLNRIIRLLLKRLPLLRLFILETLFYSYFIMLLVIMFIYKIYYKN